MATKAPNHLFDEILDLEKRTWTALKHRGADLVPYLTDDCIFWRFSIIADPFWHPTGIMMFPMGMKVTARTEPSVQDILHSPAFVPWKTFELENVDVSPVGQDGAVVSYRASATRAPATADDSDDVEFDALCSSVWRLERGKWMMCFHQQTMTT